MVRSLNVANVAQHKNPVPNAALHRGMMATSSILGKEPEADNYPPDVRTQARLCFGYLQDILAAAGATLQDVLSVELYMADKTDRDVVNQFWLQCWPDPKHRPARNALVLELPEGCKLQVKALIVLPYEPADEAPK